LIQHSEGFAGEDLSDRTTAVTPYNPAATDRAAYDFTFAWETDTQYYNAQYYEHQLEIHDFVLDQREELNLQYMFHTGDVVDDSTVEQQWLNATSAYTMLDDANLPYGVLAGNHDVGQQESDFTAFSKYFGTERYNSNDWFGGDFQDNRGHYDLITAGGMDFVMLYMGWAPTPDAIAWMNQVIQAYPERKVMINLHEFMLTTGGLGPIPQQIMDEVVAPNPNVITVFSGHYHDAFTRTDSFDDTGDGIADRTVYSMLFDYQGLPEGGLAYLRLLHFDNDLQQFTVRTYSPFLDDFDSDDPSLEPIHQEFVVPYAAFGLAPVTKSLATDSFTADILTSTQIESFSQVASGTTVSTQWAGLPVGDHGWYVVSTDPFGAVDYSPVRTLGVVPAPVIPVDPDDPTLPEEPTDPGTPVEPSPGEPGAPNPPIAEGELTDATRNGVDVPLSASPGEVIRVAVPGHVGENVRIWMHSGRLLLGTFTVDASGTAVVTIPMDASLGTTRIVVQSLDGTLIGWDGMVITAATSAAASTTASDDDLASTGTDATLALGLGGLLLALGAVLFAARRRRAQG
jgi:LPXTG-motif cell wall-anchored protein